MGKILIEQNSFFGKNKTEIIVNDFKWLNSIENELKFGFQMPFLNATANNIESKQIYRNETKIHEVINHLQTKKICLIRAAEGRGKTYLSRIVAHQLKKNNEYDVYFIDLRDSNIQVKNIDYLLNCWGKEQNNYLIVLENAHAFSELEELIETIDAWRTAENCNNLFFLLNARYTVEKFDILSSNWSEDFIVKLTPKEEDIKRIISLYEDVVNEKLQKKRKVILDADFKQFVERKIFNGIDDDNSWEGISANLRLLNIYLTIWQKNEKIDFITKISESLIIEEFGKNFRIRQLSTLLQKHIILYLSCIFQFDTPFYINKRKYEEEYNLLNNLTQQGLFYQKEDCFYLAHSIDALYLCKAICELLGYDYVEKTSYYVKEYVQCILDEEDPKSFEDNFIKLASGLLLKRELFHFLIEELIDENNKWFIKIIERLNPAFVLFFFSSYGDSNKSKNRFDFYLSNKGVFKKAILNLNRGQCGLLYRGFKKYYNYYNFINDIFENTNDLLYYLNTSSGRAGGLLRDIVKISSEHKNIIEKYRRNKHDENEKNHFGCFNSEVQLIKAKRIDRAFVKQFYHFEDVSQKISSLLRYGFYFYNLSWRSLGKFTHKIRKNYEYSYDERCIQLTEKIVTEVLIQKECIKYSTDEELSLFLRSIYYIDEAIFNKVVKEEYVIEDIKKRIQAFSYKDAELYLLGHFAFAEWCIPQIKTLILQADNNQKNRLIEWYNKVNINNIIDKKSLAWYIKECFIE